MTELALILGIQVAALAYSLIAGRGVSTSALPSTRLRRLASALERATGSFALAQGKVLLVAAPAIAALLFALHLQHDAAGAARFAAAATASVGVLAGAALAWVATHRAVALSVQTSLAATHASSQGLDQTLQVAMRAGSAIGLGTEALSALGLLGLFGSAFALRGGTTFAPHDAVALARGVTLALAGFPLGAALVALVCQRSGGIYQSAAAVGRDVASEGRFGLLRDDPRSPTIVCEIAGAHLGEAATRAALSFLTLSTSQVVTLALGLAAVAANPSTPIRYVFLPFVVHAFFVLASGFGAAVVRTQEMRTPSGGLLRGYVSTTLIGWSGVLGATFWLARPALLRFAFAGVLGTLMTALVAASVWYRLRRPASAYREAVDKPVAASSTPFTLLSAAPLILPLCALALGAQGVWQLGASEDGPLGGVWTSLVAWSALLGATPFAAAAAAVGTVASGARSVAALGAVDPESKRRAIRLEETQTTAASARAQLIVAGAITAWLATLWLRKAGSPDVAHASSLDPVIGWAGALGAAAVFVYALSCSRAALRAGREVAAEVDRQLRRYSAESGGGALPSDFSPSYKGCVDVAARSGLHRLWPHALGALATPALVAIVLRLPFMRAPAAAALEGLASCVALAMLIGVPMALAFDFSRALVTAVERAVGHVSDSSGSSSADGAAHVFAYAGAPAAHAFLVGTAALALAVAPFMN